MQKEASCHSRANERVGHFRYLFYHCCHPYIFVFNTSIGLVGTIERIVKICVTNCPILWFLWDLQNRQNWIYDFHVSPHISVPPIFKHFLIELECWNFWCLGLPFCMRLFRFFKIEVEHWPVLFQTTFKVRWELASINVQKYIPFFFIDAAYVSEVSKQKKV